MKDLTVTQKRCLELARIIREGLPGVRFDMRKFRNDCGTAGCIAGHAICKYDRFLWSIGNGRRNYRSTAGSLLGLTGYQARSMFHPYLYGDGPLSRDITPAMAAATLERFALTGKVEWRT